MPEPSHVLLVTGASRGIGAAICRLAAPRGYAIAINYLSNRDAAEALAAECRGAGATTALLPGDMSVPGDIERVFAACAEELGPVTHFVNNAGVTGKVSRLDEAAGETVRACIDLNVTGAILAAQAAIRQMARRHGGPGGAIVNLSSAAADLGSPGEYVWYAASKGAIDSLTLGLAKELAEDGIRVNAVSPGLIDTDIHALSSGAPGRAERLAPNIPMKRVGTAEEVAETVLFLLSDAASYVTGANLRVSGGR